MIQFSSVAQLCPTLCDPMNRSMPGLPVHHQLLEFTQTHDHQVGDATNHLIICHSLLPPSIIPNIRVFSNESVLHIRWPKCWSFSFSISPSNKYSELISFRIDWFDLLAVQGTLKSLLQLSVSYLFAFSCYSWRSQGKNTEVFCHSFLQVNHIHRFFFLNGKILLLSILLLTQVRMP